MFTGIIQAVGKIASIKAGKDDHRLAVRAAALDLSASAIGDSIAINGVCLTVVDLDVAGFAADVSRETLSLTTLGGMVTGGDVNLETALTLSTPLGGHLVSGHVDGMGSVRGRAEEGRSVRFSIEIPESMTRYVARKGSICVDGVSLTVNGIRGRVFDVNIIPHTLEATTLGNLRCSDSVNIEVDLVARYLESLLRGNGEGGNETGGLNVALLRQYGFIE